MIRRARPDYPAGKRLETAAYMGPRRGGSRFFNGKYGENPRDPAGGWNSFITDRVFEDYKDAGLTFLLPEGDAWFGYDLKNGGWQRTEDFRRSDLYRYCETAAAHGLAVYPAMSEIMGAMTHQPGSFTDGDKTTVRRMIETMERYFPDVFAGIMLTDEPGIAAMPRVAAIVRYLRSPEIAALAPKLGIFASMLPIYGGLTSFDLTAADDGKFAFDARRAACYTRYIDACADAIGEFCWDYYAYGREGYLSPGFYQNFELAARRAKEKGFPLSVTLQSSRMDRSPHFENRRQSGKLVLRSPTYEDMRHQVYSALAFGVRRIAYYTFWQHYSESDAEIYRDAMVVYEPSLPEGYRKTAIYDHVRAVNREVAAFGSLLRRFDWQGCMAVKKSRDRNIRNLTAGYTGSSLIRLEAGRDAIAGCFLNPEDAREGFLLVNADNPYRAECNELEAVFEGASHAVYYRAGREFDTPLRQVSLGGKTGGALHLRLGAGEGVFVLPYAGGK